MKELLIFQSLMKHFLLLCLCLFIQTANGQNLKKTLIYQDNIYSPSAIFALNEDTILTVELSNKEAVLNMHDLKSKSMIASHPAGRGPGELSQTGAKRFSRINNDLILLWDKSQRKGIVYDHNLTYITDIRYNDRSISSAIILNDSLAIVRKFYDMQTLTEIRHFKKYEITDDILLKIDTDYYGSLLPISRNPMVDQGPMFSGTDNAYIGFNYSTLVLSISSNGKVDTLKTPRSFILPTVEYDNGYSAPDHTISPEGTLSIATDDNYVFVLFSGKKFEVKPFMMAVKTITGKIADEIEKSDNTTELQIFDKKTGSYIKSVELPEMAKEIDVYGKYLYALSYVDGFYQIIKYELTL